MKSRIVRQILIMGTAGASATVVVILASVKSFPIKSRLCPLGLATCALFMWARAPRSCGGFPND
jgi:hypothetical protein